MTVQELIDKLEEIEDKTLQVKCNSRYGDDPEPVLAVEIHKALSYNSETYVRLYD